MNFLEHTNQHRAHQLAESAAGSEIDVEFLHNRKSSNYIAVSRCALQRCPKCRRYLDFLHHLGWAPIEVHGIGLIEPPTPTPSEFLP